MQVQLILAIDEFGAAVLGELSSLVAECNKKELLNRSLIYWIGAGQRPERHDYWSYNCPVWSESDPHREPIQLDLDAQAGSEINRESAFQDILDAFLGKSEFPGKNIEQLLYGNTREVFGAQIDKIHTVLVGSITNPYTGIISLAFLKAMQEIRSSGAAAYASIEYLILGIGTLADKEHEYKIARAVSARTLEDLEAYLVSADRENKAAACYIIGDEMPDGNTLDTKSQIKICATTVLALLNDCVNELESGEFHPFRFDRSNRKISWGYKDVPHDMSRPFSAVGCSTIIFPKDRIARLIAARVSISLWAAFHNMDEDFEKLIEEKDREFMKTIDGVVRDQIDLMDTIIRKKLREFDLDIPDKGETLTWIFAKKLLSSIFEKHWSSVTEYFGAKRFIKLYFDDWEQAISELEKFIEIGVLSRREVDLEEAQYIFLNSFEEALEEVFANIGLNTIGDRVRFSPRRVCLRILHTIKDTLEERIKEAEDDMLGSPAMSRGQVEELRKTVDARKKTILEKLKMVPHPIAVVFRSTLFCIAGMVIVLGLPVNLGLVDALIYRLLIGLALGGVGVLLLYRKVMLAKKELLGHFKYWLESLKEYHELRDETLKFEYARKILTTARSYVKWLLDKDDDWAEEVLYKRRKPWERVGTGFGDAINELPKKRKSYLHGYGDCVEEALLRWNAIFKRFAASIKSSRVELSLPGDISGDGNGRLADYFPNIKVLYDSCEGEDIIYFIKNVTAWIDKTERISQNSYWMPFYWSGETIPNVKPGWAETDSLPGDVELLNGITRSRSAGFRFLGLIIDYLLNTMSETMFDMEAKYYGVDVNELNAYPHAQEELYNHLNTKSRIPIKCGEAGFEHLSVICRGKGDSLAYSINAADYYDISRNMVALIRVQFGLTAGDLIFGGNEESPLSNIGRAHKELGSKIQQLKIQ